MQHPLKQPCNAPATLVVVRLLSIALFITHAHPFTAHAAVPLDWTAHPGQTAPVTFDRFHGETLDFRCTFQGFSPDGQTVFGQNQEVRLFWQTNGMETSWWSVPAAVSSNVIAATWSPDLDPGADRVLLFFGAPSNAYAAAVLRLRHSPGFTPATPPPPAAFTESDPVFSAWRSTFQETDPVFSTWLSTNDQRSVIRDTIADYAATGTVSRASSYGTPTRWTDATGCVWEVSVGAWLVTHSPPLGENDSFGGPEWVGDDSWVGDYFTGPGWYIWATSMTYEMISSDPKFDSYTREWYGNDSDYTTTCIRPTLTNLVGRVAYTNDLPSTNGFLRSEADPNVYAWAKSPTKPTYTAQEVGATDGNAVTSIVRSVSRGGLWDPALGVWWTPQIVNGAYQWVATTNVDLSAEEP